MAKDIETCQSKDIKVLLSLGGATGSYNLATADDGKRLAETLWAMFGAGSSPSLHRPFGDASVDGFDLDIEAGAAGGYAAFIDRMRELYATDQTKTYYIGGAPQCPFPDVYLDHALEHAWFDFVWYCNVIGSQFNYDAWEKWARTKSINKDVRVLVGLPGSPASANPSHYADVELLTPILSPLLKTAPHFGGVMMWDASSAHANRITSEQSYAEAIAEYLSDSKRTNSSLETTAAGATSTRMSPSATSRSRTTESTSYHVSSTRSPTIPTATASSAVLSGDTMFNGTAACSPHGAWICHPLVPSRLGQCVYGQWVFHECGAGLICRGNRAGPIYCDYDDLISTLLPTATPTLVE
ncbi:glycoside hydrolase superfamily [Syncephalastrum racemosum]|uniref:chitinase n=1 Tax=Syncephalastrum racemosum TaxID=13706 RepID=A0A1X2HED1_SYNRA|nr:glycoside hydrolase superfamily [Syncephalastrum racemosum]